MAEWFLELLSFVYIAFELSKAEVVLAAEVVWNVMAMIVSVQVGLVVVELHVALRKIVFPSLYNLLLLLTGEIVLPLYINF